MKNTIWVVSLSIVSITLLILSVIGFSTRVSQASVNTQVSQAENAIKTSMEVQNTATVIELKNSYDTQMAGLNDQINSLTTDKSSASAENEKLASEIDALQLQIKDLETTTEPVIDNSYLINDISLAGTFEKELDNSDVPTLVDTTITYNGDKYDVYETLSLSDDFRPLLNVEDSNGAVKVGITDSGAIVYNYNFYDSIVINDSDLAINFLGEPLSIVSSGDNSITYRTSKEFSGAVGKSFNYNGNTIKILAIDSDNEDVQISVNDINKVITEGESRNFDGLNVLVKTVFASTFNDYSYVKLYVGDEITKTVTTGDYYTPNEDYEWVIDGDSNGLTSVGLTYVGTLEDSDEVLGVGDSFVLPNNYVTFTFKAIKNLNVKDVSMKIGRASCRERV